METHRGGPDVNTSPGKAKANCGGDCAGCVRAAEAQARRDGGTHTKGFARRGLRRFQTVTGFLLLLSSATGVYLLASDKSLWLLAVSHAVGLVMIVLVDLVLGLYSLSSAKTAYLPSIAAAVLGFSLQLGDVFTAPQYNMTIAYFAHYLFGLWAFDLLLALQAGVVLVGLAGRPHARYLARMKTRRGRELDYSRRSLIKAFVALGGLIGLGVAIGSIKLPAPAAPSTQPATTATQTGSAKGSVANTNNLQVGSPTYFDYPSSGYPNMLMKNADGSLTALSMLCTHVCCQCSYSASTKTIYCPCHGSEFDSSGKVIRGPASADLPTISLRIDSAGNVFPAGVNNPGPCQA
ncbi:MAG: Rieske 2Fe-2S domain-containing protein [Nitrososphaerales archaeon]